MSIPGSLAFDLPPAADDIPRKIADLQRALQEGLAARSLEATSIGEGGLTVIGGSIEIQSGGDLIVDGDATFNGSLTVPAGSLNTAGNVSAGGDITAGDDIIAGDTVQGANLVSTGGASVSGTLSAGAVSAGSAAISGNLTANGEIRMPNVPVTILTTAYFATYASTNDGGRVGHVPSSARFKQEIVPATLDPDQLLALQVVTFRYIAAIEELGEDADREIGLIAEDVHALGMTWLVYYDADGLPFGIRYERLALALLPMVQHLHADVVAIKSHLGI